MIQPAGQTTSLFLTSQYLKHYNQIQTLEPLPLPTNELPRNCREMTMVASLRGMGFTCTREILTALQIVASKREEIYGVGNEGNVNEQRPTKSESSNTL